MCTKLIWLLKVYDMFELYQEWGDSIQYEAIQILTVKETVNITKLTMKKINCIASYI